MILGISATQVTQLVAQKLTSVTLPFRSAVVLLLPSSSTKVDSGAAYAPPHPDRLTSAASATPTASAMRHTVGGGDVHFHWENLIDATSQILIQPVCQRAGRTGMLATYHQAHALSIGDLPAPATPSPAA